MNISATPTSFDTLTDWVQRAARATGRWLGLLPANQVLPRQRCHFVLVPLRGVPRKHIESAIRLRLQQLGLFEQIGLAYRIVGDAAQVWYWDDALARRLFPGGHALPWPEPLWREPLQTGSRLVHCAEGYELEGVNPQGIYRSRWYAQRPGDDERQAFHRDLGITPDAGEASTATPEARKSPQTGWRALSAAARPVPAWVLICLLLITVAGAIAVIEVIQITRINQQARLLEVEVKQLRRQTATLSALEAAARQLQPTTDALLDYSHSPRQLHWLAQMAQLGIIGQVSDAYIADWVYRSGNVTTTLRLGPKAKSADVLSMLEKATLFDDVVLLPDPPQGTLRVQLKLPAASASTPPQASDE
ncbi:hypothetical protein IGB42_04128 [Andreprevotia sp. IGB-42]|uniref:hypothetical protein n=1 Tax=Andreprevotia sp. IGB-42 TaxID=2497473 RepID=UPI0013571EF5|nr:hypothetical protein [Andreprevotia sp. IGB-42]KAF0811429.1 hypothetical protein IGB42_04128 [Andreprevotia sp. IGB-42]